MLHIQLISLFHYERKLLLKEFNDKTTLTNTTVLNYENLQFLVLSSFLEDVATFVNSLVVKSEQHFLYLSFCSLESYTHQCCYCNTFQCVVQSESAFVAALWNLWIHFAVFAYTRLLLWYIGKIDTVIISRVKCHVRRMTADTIIPLIPYTLQLTCSFIWLVHYYALQNGGWLFY